MRCPGQDRRYWKEDAAYEVPCPKCGLAVEIFKDESRGRCSSCGHRFLNPGVDFGCAKWCSLAEECLGLAPEREAPSRGREGALAAQLIQAIEEEFSEDQARIAHALRAFQYAKELVRIEGGDPRVVLAAVLLLETELHGPAGKRNGETPGPARAKQILQRIGLDEDTTKCVCRIIRSCRTGRDVEEVEFRIVSDSDTLAKLAADKPGGDLDRLQDIIQNRLRTEAGKEKARRMFQIPPPSEKGDRSNLPERPEGCSAQIGPVPFFPPQDNLARATGTGFEAVGRQPDEQLLWLGAEATGNGWRLPVLADTFEVDVLASHITTSDDREVGPHWSILALHYLAITSRPERRVPEVTFADLRAARSYAGVYHARVIARLCATAGWDAQSLRSAASDLGGRVADAGDVAFDFTVFPRLSVRLIWHAPDEEFPPSATLLLPGNIESYFCSEDIVVLSERLVSRVGGRPF